MLVDNNGFPILSQYSEEGFIDCIFKVDDLQYDKTHYYFNLLASHNGERVGFAVKMIKTIGPGFDNDMNLIQDHVYHHGISFRSLGEISDRFMTVLANLYELGLGDLQMISEETFTAIALQQSDKYLELHSVKLKLFGKDGKEFSQDDYYESFFNVDLPNMLVSWNEKDADYRSPLVKALRVV